MSASLVQAEYEQLETVAARFGQQAENNAKLTRFLEQRTSVLIAGSWQGQGVEAFAAEMEAAVLPALRRLTDALQTGQRATIQISAIMRAAEEEAARPFMDGGAGGDGAGQAGADAGVDGDAPPTSSQSLVVRDPSSVFSESYMKNSIGSHFRAENSAELNSLMEQLHLARGKDTDVGPILDRMADLRGVDRATFHAQYQKFLELMENGNAIGGNYPDIDLGKHGNFLGTTVSLRYGKIVGDVFGIDPVFGALLNPTGGLVGPGSDSYQPSPNDAIGYHGTFHDAGGYLYNYHGIGPGYDYLGRESRPTNNPWAGQIGGISWWMSQPGLEVDVLPNLIPDIPFVPKFVEHGIGEALEGPIISGMRVISSTAEGAADIVDGISDVFSGDIIEGVGDITGGAGTVVGGVIRSVGDWFD